MDIDRQQDIGDQDKNKGSKDAQSSQVPRDTKRCDNKQQELEKVSNNEDKNYDNKKDDKLDKYKNTNKGGKDIKGKRKMSIEYYAPIDDDNP